MVRQELIGRGGHREGGGAEMDAGGGAGDGGGFAEGVAEGVVHGG